MRVLWWKSWQIIPALLLLVILTGCATTPRIDWSGRIGNYTYEQAILEFGPPDKHATLTDGTVVAEWLTRRGYVYSYAPAYRHYPWYYGPIYQPSYIDTYSSPDSFLRLIFFPDGRLQDYRQFSR
jgi:hypothetical protein